MFALRRTVMNLQACLVSQDGKLAHVWSEKCLQKDMRNGVLVLFGIAHVLGDVIRRPFDAVQAAVRSAHHCCCQLAHL